MAKRRVECAKYRCTDPPFMVGLCRRHHEEDEANKRRRSTALKLLDSGRLDNEPPGAGPLREEFYRLQDWWRQVCDCIISSREHPVLRDEARYADSWCIGLAELIIDEERERRAGQKVDVDSHQYLRKQLWERFDNLERGLGSNGVERS